MDGTVKSARKRGREDTKQKPSDKDSSSSAAPAAAANSKNKSSSGSSGKNKKKVMQAFDTPYKGSKGVQIIPGSAETQSNALAALSRLSSALSGRKNLAKVFVFGVNAVCRAVEAGDAPKRIAACCISSPTPAAEGSRIAFGIGSPTEVLSRHIALCCARHKIPVVILSETDSAEPTPQPLP